MTTTLEAVRAVLVANATVSGLVGTRIYPVKAPDSAVAPYVVCRVVSKVDENTFTNENTPLGNTRLQIDSYAAKYLDAHAVAQAIYEVVRVLSTPALSAWRIGERDLFDDAAQLHNASADYAVWI